MAIIEEIQGYHFSAGRLLFYTLILLTSGLVLLYRKQQKSKLYRLGNKIPGPIAIPIFGNALLALGKKPSGMIFVY